MLRLVWFCRLIVRYDFAIKQGDVFQWNQSASARQLRLNRNPVPLGNPIHKMKVAASLPERRTVSIVVLPDRANYVLTADLKPGRIVWLKRELSKLDRVEVKLRRLSSLERFMSKSARLEVLLRIPARLEGKMRKPSKRAALSLIGIRAFLMEVVATHTAKKATKGIAFNVVLPDQENHALTAG